MHITGIEVLEKNQFIPLYIFPDELDIRNVTIIAAFSQTKYLNGYIINKYKYKLSNEL